MQSKRDTDEDQALPRPVLAADARLGAGTVGYRRSRWEERTAMPDGLQGKKRPPDEYQGEATQVIKAEEVAECAVNGERARGGAARRASGSSIDDIGAVAEPASDRTQIRGGRAALSSTENAPGLLRQSRLCNAPLQRTAGC